MFVRETLPNGVRVVVEEVPFAHSVAVGIWVRTGSRDEEDSLQGVSHFIEHLMFKGTPTRSARRIAEELEEVGGSLNAFTTKEYTCYYARVLADHFNLAVNVLSDMFFNSNMGAEDIEREKRVVLEEIKLYEDTPDESIHDLFARTIWEGHSLGRAILGTTESVNGLTRDAIVSYYRHKYNSSNVVIAVAGKIEERQVLEKLASVFGTMPASDYRPRYTVPEPHAKINLQKKETEQLQLCLGFPGLAQDDNDIYALNILNNVLGGGLSSRLFQTIREERGLAYSVFSYQSCYADCGLFAVYAGISQSNINEVLTVILAELAQVKNQGITPQELKRTKDQSRGSLLLGQENVGNRMSRLGKSELTRNRIDSLDEILRRVDAVTLEQIQSLASRILDPERAALTCIGAHVPALDLGEYFSAAKF